VKISKTTVGPKKSKDLDWKWSCLEKAGPESEEAMVGQVIQANAQWVGRHLHLEDHQKTQQQINKLLQRNEASQPASTASAM